MFFLIPKGYCHIETLLNFTNEFVSKLKTFCRKISYSGSAAIDRETVAEAKERLTVNLR